MKKQLFLLFFVTSVGFRLAARLSEGQWINRYSIDKMPGEQLSLLADALYQLKYTKPSDTQTCSTIYEQFNARSQGRDGSHFVLKNALVKAVEEATVAAATVDRAKQQQAWSKEVDNFYKATVKAANEKGASCFVESCLPDRAVAPDGRMARSLSLTITFNGHCNSGFFIVAHPA